jgi:hypothetical protein
VIVSGGDAGIIGDAMERPVHLSENLVLAGLSLIE